MSDDGYAKVKVYVYHEGQRVGMVRCVNSLQWMPEWSDVGEIKMVCALTTANQQLLQKWETLYNPDTPNLAAIIISVNADTDKSTITVRGQFSLRRFKQRIAKGSRIITDAAAGLLELCYTNLRGLPVTVPENAGFTAPCQETVEWIDCCAGIVQLAKAGGFGVRVRFDELTGSEQLELLQGKDRSVQGSEWYRGGFDTRLRNLTNVSQTMDVSDYANVALCGGEAPSENDAWQQLWIEVGDTAAQGANRHELWVDGSSVTHRHTIQKPDGSTEEATYTEEEYKNVLTNYATAALLNHYVDQSLKATAVDLVIRYGEDYDLGDRLPVKVPELGLEASAQVISIKLTYEATGRKIIPVFDNIEFGGDEN